MLQSQVIEESDPYPTIIDATTNYEKERTSRNKQRITIVGRRYYTQVSAKSTMPSVISVAKNGYFGKVCESADLQVKEKNRVSHQNFTKDGNEYPSTMVTIKINGQRHTMKVDSGAEVNIISASTYKEFRSKPVLQPSESNLKSYGLLLLPLMGQFAATIATNRKQIETIMYVTKNHNTRSLTSRYTACDLSILHINVNNQQVPINLHNIDVRGQYRKLIWGLVEASVANLTRLKQAWVSLEVWQKGSVLNLPQREC